ncbi:rod binding protein [Litoreibacter ponti]|uniref:Rod binding protein n=1 Tax=Litoreibacter ponti TaxID=1510457 RepID=A0A2T6BNG6_9RHOB|nr:rod binding protein [Litoreibacter ponti]
MSGSLPTAVDQKVLARLDAAKGLEAAFIAEMLKSIAPDTSSQAFGGGIGEEQFQSFLFENQARAMVDRGGIGLAEQFVRSMERMP